MSTVSLSGLEFSKIFNSYVDRCIDHNRESAIEVIKNAIALKIRYAESNHKAMLKHNAGFLVLFGLSEKYTPRDLDLEKRMIKTDILSKYTIDGDINNPIHSLVFSVCSYEDREILHQFQNCSLSDNAIITLPLKQYQRMI